MPYVGCLQVGFFPYLLHHVQSQSAVSQLLDLSHLATAGHSRGGKLAALQLAGVRMLETMLIRLCLLKDAVALFHLSSVAGAILWRTMCKLK